MYYCLTDVGLALSHSYLDFVSYYLIFAFLFAFNYYWFFQSGIIDEIGCCGYVLVIGLKS